MKLLVTQVILISKTLVFLKARVKSSAFLFTVLFAFIFLDIKAQQLSTCPASPCVPIFKSKSALPDSAFFNCVKSKILDPKLDGSSNILFKWTSPDGTVTNGLNIIATMAGKYILCYDTSGPFAGTCPKSDTVIVTEFKKKFADAGPDFKVCSDTRLIIGNDKTDIAKYSYNWVPATSFLLGDANKNNPLFRKKIDSPTIFSGALILEQTEIVTGCVSKDSVLFVIQPSPTLRIDNIKSTYCAGEQAQINLLGFNTSLNFQNVTFSINDIPQPLPPKREERIKFTNFGVRYQDQPFPTNVYAVQFPADKIGFNSLKFSVTSSEGCVANIDSNRVQVNAANSNIEIKGLNNPSYCSDHPDPVGLLALKQNQPTSAGVFASSPYGGAITGNAASGYFFDPKLAVPGQNTITYTEPRIGNSCGATGSINVNIVKAPTPKVIGRTSVCPGALAAVYEDTANVSNQVIRNWEVQPGNAYTISPDNKSITVNWQNNAGESFIRVVNDDMGCSSVTQIVVRINKTLKSKIPVGEKTLCTGLDSIAYNAESDIKYMHKWFVVGGNVNTRFKQYTSSEQVKVKWDPGQANYWLWVRDSSTFDNTCYGNSDTLKIQFVSDPFAAITTAIGAGVCKNASFKLSANPSGGDDFTWNPGNLKGSNITIDKADTTRVYVLTVSKGNTCPEKTDSIQIRVNPVPANPLPMPDFQICFEGRDTIIRALVGDPANTFIWNNDLTANQQYLVINKAGKYSVVQTNKFGCSSEGSINITDNCPTEIFIPQAFSPNNDGINDSLRVFGSNFSNFTIKIYNRWGEVVFASNSRFKSWDGNYNGVPAPAGAYPWVITYQSSIDTEGYYKETFTRKGSIILSK